ncbi:MAG: DUF5684 domain-containing protein [Lachnotalea sp.]
MWRIYEKANVAGWKSIIPIYNAVCLYTITWGSGWIFLTCFIPFVNIVICIITTNKLTQSFGKVQVLQLVLYFYHKFLCLSLVLVVRNTMHFLPFKQYYSSKKHVGHISYMLFYALLFIYF